MPGLTPPTTLGMPPDLAEFAGEAVASGRYESPSAVVIAAIKFLRDAEAERVAFIASLEKALAEDERPETCLSDDLFTPRVARDLTDAASFIARGNRDACGWY